ncbi:hypothetical protein [Geodermatophilus sp. SYSU D01119]
MSTDGPQVSRPGRVIPRSAIHRCGGDDRAHESTDAAGHRSPPLPDGCRVLGRAARHH